MTNHDDRVGSRLMRGALAGAVAGVAASFAMDRFQAAVSALSSSDDDAEPATEQAADAIARTVAGREIAGADKPLAGQAVHYAFGVGLGLAYGVAAEFRPAITRGSGAIFGVGTATLFDETAVPAAGLGDPPWQADLSTSLYSYASHLVFAVVAEQVRKSVAATLVPA